MVDELSGARLSCERLKGLLHEALEIVRTSPDRDRVFEVAGHLLRSIPEELVKLERGIEATALAASRLDYEELKSGLQDSKVEELERSLSDARVPSIPRRSGQAPGSSQLPLKGLPMRTFQAANQAHISTALRRISSLVRVGDILPNDVTDRLRWVRVALSQTAEQAVEAMGPLRGNSREEVMEGFKKSNPDLSQADLDEIADHWEKNRNVVKDKTASEPPAFKAASKVRVANALDRLADGVEAATIAPRAASLGLCRIMVALSRTDREVVQAMEPMALRSREQVVANLGAANPHLSRDCVERISALWEQTRSANLSGPRRSPKSVKELNDLAKMVAADLDDVQEHAESLAKAMDSAENWEASFTSAEVKKLADAADKFRGDIFGWGGLSFTEKK